MIIRVGLDERTVPEGTVVNTPQDALAVARDLGLAVENVTQAITTGPTQATPTVVPMNDFIPQGTEVTELLRAAGQKG